jgi:release factor glutamine methyltransferase
LVEEVIKLINARDNVTVLDIGTGSGAIAITLQKETNAKVYAVDVSKKALEIAKMNAKINNATIEFRQIITRV